MKRRGARRGPRNRAAPALVFGAAAGILCLAACLWFAGGGQDVGPEDKVGGPFNLVDDSAHPVTERSFAGKYLLVYFGYATCPDVCPETLNTMAASLDRLGRKAARVQPLFITVDPMHDTPAVLRHYVSGFSSRLVGLTGSEAELNKVAASYHVFRAPHHGQGGRLDHSAVLYLMAPDGRFVAPIPADASEMVMLQAIARYVS
jgi:protein SCO1/2